MNNGTVLYEEYRLVERSETDITGIWKCAHLIVFLLAFIFGSFCTICFHVVMYMFDDKCVLFPKLVTLNSVNPAVLQEFWPQDNSEPPKSTELAIEFFVTQWADKKECYLPAFVPLVSGIFGVIWTSMFLMCNSGSWTLGLRRPWWVLPLVSLFSVAMSGMCIYSSIITHYGLKELITKLCTITGDTTCTYTINVATLVYKKHIRGVYEAITLTLVSAWLHTSCWLLSATLALSRIILVVDFQLVKVQVELKGDLEKLMERQEEQLRTVTPERSHRQRLDSIGTTTKDIKIYYENKMYHRAHSSYSPLTFLRLSDDTSSLSNYTLLAEERFKNARETASKIMNKPKRIPHLLFGIEGGSKTPSVSSVDSATFEIAKKIKRQKEEYTLDTLEKDSVDKMFTKLSDSGSKVDPSIQPSVLQVISNLEVSKTGSSPISTSELELGHLELKRDSDSQSVISERKKKSLSVMSLPTDSQSSNSSQKKKKKEKED